MKIISMIGEVPCDLHPAASRVRVSIPGIDGIPLSIKATFGDFDRKVFKKGRVVEVRESHQYGKRCFMINRVFSPVDVKRENITLRVEVENAEEWRERNFPKEEEKVRFYLCSNYFSHPDLHDVLRHTLGVTPDEFSQFKRQNNGITFVCTTDQFARFLIVRNMNGIKNGFMDLSAKLIKPKPAPDAYSLLAKAVGITRDQAKRTALALCYKGPEDILERIRAGWEADETKVSWLDVSDR